MNDPEDHAQVVNRGIGPRPCSHCGWPEPLPPGSYLGEPLTLIDGSALKRLTEHERRHSVDDRYCLSGHTHWVPADFFLRHAESLRAEADRLEQAGQWLAERIAMFGPETYGHEEAVNA